MNNGINFAQINHSIGSAIATGGTLFSSISASLSSNPGSSAGIGGDSNQASSTTKAAISGIAGNKAARTGDAQTGITPIFDANQVQQEINAQTQITKEFGAQASRAIGDYAQSQLQAAQQQQSTGQSLQQKANQAKSEGRSQEAQVLQAQANEAMAAANELRQQWGEYGSRRIILHTLIGGLTGNAPGAVGAAAGTLTAPTVANALNNTNVPKPLANAITGLAATLVGGAAGGAPGAAGASNEVTNNYLTHIEEKQLKAAKQGCAKDGNIKHCIEQKQLEDSDKRRDAEIQPLVEVCRITGTYANCDAVAKHYAQTNGYGYLSMKHESNNRSGTPFSKNAKLVGNGDSAYYQAPFIKRKDGSYHIDPGGVSYGPFQLSSESGGLEDFLNYLKNKAPGENARVFYQELEQVGGIKAAREGKPSFMDKFMELTKKNPQFVQYQFESINQGSNMRYVRNQLNKIGINFDQLSSQEKEAIFSTAVQHGGGGAGKAIAVAGQNFVIDPEQAIIKLYEWRITINPAEAKSRYVKERNMLLEQLRGVKQ